MVNETLRLTPVAIAVPRRLREAVTLAGYTLPAGTNVGASIYVAHRSQAWDSCVSLAPGHFESGADGKALARCGGGPAPAGTLTGLTLDQSNQVREAAMFCPPEAISVWDADTGEQYFP